MSCRCDLLLAVTMCVGFADGQPKSAAVERAKTLLHAGQEQQAAEVLRNTIAAGDDIAAAHGELGLLLYRQGKFDDAVQELGRAAQLDPQSPDYSLKLAGSIIAQQRFPVALEFLNAVRSRFENLAEYQYNLGLGHYGRSDGKPCALVQASHSPYPSQRATPAPIVAIHSDPSRSSTRGSR